MASDPGSPGGKRAPLIRSFGPPPVFARGRLFSEGEGRAPGQRPGPSVSAMRPSAANQRGRRRSSQSRARSPPQRRDVVGQKHEAERKHPQPKNRQDGEASADDQQDA